MLYQPRVRRAIAGLAVLPMTVVGAALALTPAVAQDGGEPFFAVSPIEPADHMWGLGWLSDSEVQVDIDDPAVGGEVDFTTALPTDGDGRFEVYDLPFDIQAGHTVTVSQSADVSYLKTHDVIDLTVTDVDPVTDTVSGIGAADTATHVNVGPSLDVVVTSDGTGAWTADLGSEGFDIVPGTTVYVYQADDDFDQTQIDYAIPDGNFNVGYAQYPPTASSDFIYLHNWQVGSTLTISIDDPTVDGDINHEVTEIVVVSTEGFVVDIGPAFDIETGHIVTVSDGHVAPSLVVTNLEITSADPASDLVTGLAEPGKPVFVTPDYVAEYWVNPASDASWQVDMGDYDLQPGGGVAAQQYDETGNATQFDYNIPEAQLLVSPFSPPVDNHATNVARAGRSVPFKFRVTDGNEAPVTDLIEVDVIVELKACDPSLATDAIERYVSSTGLVNKGDGYYQYNIKTNKAWAGKCGRLGVDVGSGGIRTADFLFR